MHSDTFIDSARCKVTQHKITAKYIFCVNANNTCLLLKSAESY